MNLTFATPQRILYELKANYWSGPLSGRRIVDGLTLNTMCYMRLRTRGASHSRGGLFLDGAGGSFFTSTIDHTTEWDGPVFIPAPGGGFYTYRTRYIYSGSATYEFNENGDEQVAENTKIRTTEFDPLNQSTPPRDDEVLELSATANPGNSETLSNEYTQQQMVAALEGYLANQEWGEWYFEFVWQGYAFPAEAQVTSFSCSISEIEYQWLVPPSVTGKVKLDWYEGRFDGINDGDDKSAEQPSAIELFKCAPASNYRYNLGFVQANFRQHPAQGIKAYDEWWDRNFFQYTPKLSPVFTPLEPAFFAWRRKQWADEGYEMSETATLRVVPSRPSPYDSSVELDVTIDPVYVDGLLRDIRIPSGQTVPLPDDPDDGNGWRYWNPGDGNVIGTWWNATPRLEVVARDDAEDQTTSLGYIFPVGGMLQSVTIDEDIDSTGQAPSDDGEPSLPRSNLGVGWFLDLASDWAFGVRLVPSSPVQVEQTFEGYPVGGKWDPLEWEPDPGGNFDPGAYFDIIERDFHATEVRTLKPIISVPPQPDKRWVWTHYAQAPDSDLSTV